MPSLFSTDTEGRMASCKFCKCVAVARLLGHPVCAFHEAHGDVADPCAGCARDPEERMTSRPTTKPKRCAECRDGEHDNLDDDVRLCVVTNPDGGPPRRANLCGEHRQARRDDGYTVRETR